MKIDPNDEAAEREAEKYLGMYIQSLIDQNISPQTARIYLYDLKYLLEHVYNYKPRKPLEKFLAKHLRFCKQARLGNEDTDKYSEEKALDLIEKIRTIEETQHSSSQVKI